MHVPWLSTEPFTLHMQPGVSVADIQKEVERRIEETGASLPAGEYGLFESAEKLILNASPPISQETLLLMLEEVRTAADLATSARLATKWGGLRLV